VPTQPPAVTLDVDGVVTLAPVVPAVAVPAVAVPAVAVPVVAAVAGPVVPARLTCAEAPADARASAMEVTMKAGDGLRMVRSLCGSLMVRSDGARGGCPRA
jgi:hypothetical protein